VIYTQSIWEDFLITFRHTENLVLGNGLVYQVGERVHGFTSVINTLLPALPRALGAGLTGSLAFYQLCSLAALSAGLWMLLRALLISLKYRSWELLALAALVASSAKIVSFSSNGQEGGFLVGFLALGLAAILRLEEPQSWKLLGYAITGLLYTRPDSPLYVVVLAVIAWSHGTVQALRAVKVFVRAGLLACMLYLPWFLWAWWYYGSPIPHTIVAKSTGSLLIESSVVKTLLAMSPQVVMGWINVFGPIYPPGNWPDALLVAGLVGAVAVTFYWVLPVRDGFGRGCSAGVFILLGYLSFVGSQRLAFPWYFVPVSLLAALVVVSALRVLWQTQRRGMRALAMVALAWVVLTNVTVLAMTFRQMRVQQEEIENGTRRAIGLFLRNHARPGDTVYAECLGYIGYYFGGKMLDYPGLVAPEVVRARREHGDKLELVPEVLKPDWIVGRPHEIEAILKREALRDSYEVVGNADARARLDARGRFAGDASLRFDDLFYVLRRRGDKAAQK
jgi:hypothetical protein